MAPLGSVMPPWAAWGVVRGAACDDRPCCEGCCCCGRGCCCPEGLSQCKSCRWSVRAGGCEGEGGSTSRSCGGGTAQGGQLLEAAALRGVWARRSAAMLCLRWAFACLALFGRLLSDRTSAALQPAASARGGGVPVNARGLLRVHGVTTRWLLLVERGGPLARRVPSAREGGGASSPKAGSAPPPSSSGLLQPSSTPLGRSAGPTVEGPLFVRTLTGDSGWLLLLCETRRVAS